jgi:hypothetical protein
VTADGPQPPPRVSQFVERLRDSPPERPSGGRPLSWVLWRFGIAAALAVGLSILTWAVLFDMACACTPRPSFPASPVEGVVVGVDAAGLGNVRGFDLWLTGGGSLHLSLGTLENATEFSPSHLTEHLASSEPIRAYFRVDGGGYQAVVYRLEDAPR